MFCRKTDPPDLTDVREGESFIATLYFDIRHVPGKTDQEIEIPLRMDFRTR